MKLHLGAFNSPVIGWINTDITPHQWITRVPFLPELLFKLGKMTEERLLEHKRGVFKKISYLNLYKRFPYPDNTFTSVFSSHVLEHLFPHQIPAILAEIKRVLVPGGVVRVVVPDLDLYVKRYDPENPEEMLAAIFEHQNGLKNRHQWMYTKESLVHLLQKNGFSNVKSCSFRKGKCEDLDRIDNRAENSIYVEGEKG